MSIRTSTTHLLIAVVVSLLITATATVAQVPPPSPKPAQPAYPKPKENEPKEKEKPPKSPGPVGLPPNIQMGEGTTTERSLAVDTKVNIQMCVTQGSLKINGWKRNEVRAFVGEGSKFGFRVLQKSVKGEPALISIVAVKKLPGGGMTTAECIAGQEVELDVPENAAVTIKGRETETTVDTVRKVLVENGGGDISIRNVAQGVRATTYQGNVTVENSQGMLVLNSGSGNIVAYEVGPADVGDTFKAKTNSGSISLQKVEYLLADVNSISGSIVFTGELLSGGSYMFGTTNGAIRLALPSKTSCRITATYGYGSFNAEFPMKTLTEDVRPGSVKTINALIGDGDATLRLTTSNGSILIKRIGSL